MEKFEYTGTEQEFLKQYKEQEIQKYDKPSVTVDCVMLRYNEGNVEFLMIKRKGHPFQGKYALPGGFVNKDEDLTKAVLREVEEETSVKLNEDKVEQLITVGTPFRDPRHWVITVAHLVYLEHGQTIEPAASDDASSVHWVSIDVDDNNNVILTNTSSNETISNEEIAFDHYSIITEAVNRVRGRLEYKPTSLKVMPKLNTILEYRMFFGKFEHKYKGMNSSTFLRKFNKLFTQTSEVDKTHSFRPASLYSWSVE